MERRRFPYQQLWAGGNTDADGITGAAEGAEARRGELPESNQGLVKLK